MSQPVFLRDGIRLAIISILEPLLPAIVVVANLYAITVYQEVFFTEYFMAFAVIAALLSMAAFRTNHEMPHPYSSEPLALGVQVIVRWMVIVFVLLLIAYVTKFSSEFARRAILPWVVTSPVLIWVSQLVLRSVMRWTYLSRRSARTAVVAGFNESSRSLVEEIGQHKELGIRLLGLFDDRSADRLGIETEFDHLGGLPEMADFVRRNNVDIVFIALPIRQIKRMMDQMDNLRDSTASIYYVPDVFVFNLIQSQVSTIQGVPVVAMCETPMHGFNGAVKRAIDVVLTLAILLVIFPLLFAIALAVKLSSPGPVIFKQRRYGLDGKEIVVFKFRSMTVQEDGATVQQATRCDNRVTKVGAFLRRHSLDELPQLFNVLEGTMSLVGPRPHAVTHNEQYRKMIKGYMVRHKVLPGITGLAQVNGCRGETEQVEKMEARIHYDMDYLRHWTPLLDIKIIVMTIIGLLRRDNQAY